jgi:hypothetical protein
MRWLRRWFYNHGFRPREGTILYSPGLAAVHEFNDVWESILNVIRDSSKGNN